MSTKQVGFIVIGRNEGRNLGDALQSLPADASAVLYVDSGSTDDSVAVAIEKRISVHQLDPSAPFSAARARKEGVARLLDAHPEVDFIQFLDGDCVLEPGWVEDAVGFLRRESGIGVVCGLLVERCPEASVFNRFNAARWRVMPVGEINGSGGIFMASVDAYRTAGGFRSELLTGEEMDFCNRLRGAGYRVVRIPVAMATHDSELLSFRDWWARAVWGGRGDALQFEVLGRLADRDQRREIRSVWIWAVVMPVLLVSGAVLSIWDGRFLLLCAAVLAGYAVVAARILRAQLRQGERWADAGIYSLLAVFRKLPYALGFLSYRRKY